MNHFPLSSMFALAMLLILVGVGCRQLGTAVVLWPPDGSSWQAGDLVKVKDESILRHSYIVDLPENRRLKTEIDTWRLRLFRQEKDAIAWREELGEWRNFYAQSKSQGLPLRSEASNLSTSIYRLRTGERVKILNRNPGPVPVGNLNGFWYHVLAEGGVSGYVFDYNLEIIHLENGQSTVLNAQEKNDAQLENFLSMPWRPKIFEQMISRHHFDFKIFAPQYGLFPDKENQRLTLRLPETTLIETWDSIIPARNGRYDFLGTSFRIIINSENFISVQYNDLGNARSEAFVRLEKGIQEYIDKELERRQAHFKIFLDRGPGYSSRSYGNLLFTLGDRFSWTGKSSLISRGLLTSVAGNQGNIQFHAFLSPRIATRHDGVLSLQFDSGESIQFLHKFEERGLRLLYIPPSAVQDEQVMNDQFIDPIQLFFFPEEGGESSIFLRR